MRYELLDSGEGSKLERFGSFVLSRPCSQAVWLKQRPEEWNRADAVFSREQENRWDERVPLPKEWYVELAGISFKISTTDFGHLGIFPEQKSVWDWLQATISEKVRAGMKPRILNLFAYSGGSTLAAAKAGASVCHLDASKGMVSWARENAALNHLDHAPIRWIVEDVSKFLKREQRRGSRYEGIILDPPSFGRGPKGEIFKIEETIIELLEDCRSLLSDQPLFLLLSCHTPGFTPIGMHNLLSQTMRGFSGAIESGEMAIAGDDAAQFKLPSGTFARWSR